MLKPFLKFSNRTIIVVLEIFAVIFLLLAITFSIFAWRLSQGPISLAFAKEYLQEALSNKDQGIFISFDDIVLTWPEYTSRFQLDLKGLKVSKGEKDANVLSIKEASVGLSRRALLIGHIRPVSVIIKNPSVELVRSSNGNMDVFIQGNTQKMGPIKPDEKPFGESIADIFVDMAENKAGSFFSRLDQFEVMDASVAVRDKQFGLSWYLTNLDFNLQESLRGVSASVNIPLPGGKQKNANMSFDIVYRKQSEDFKASGNFEDINPYFISRFLPLPETVTGQDLFFSGSLDATMDKEMNVQSMVFNGQIPEGSIVAPNQFNQDIPLKNIVLKSEYDGANKTFTLSDLSGEIGGISVKGHGEAISNNAVIAAPIKFNFNDLTSKEILSVFPKSEQDGEAYLWLSKKIEGAKYKDVSLNMELTASKTRDEVLQRDEWSVKAPKLNVDFGFDDAKITYNDTLMPVENASGKGSLDLATEILEVTGDKAKIGDIDGTDIHVKVTDLLAAGKGFVTVKAKIKGPLSTALSYIALDPIKMGKDEIGIDAKAVKGGIDAALDISMPTLKDVPKEQVDVKVDGTLSDLNIPDIVKGLPLSGGPLNLLTEPGGFKIKGKAQLAGRDISLDWHQYFESKGKPYAMKISTSVAADQYLRHAFGIDLDDYISGIVPIDVVYTDNGNDTASVEASGNLNSSRIYIDPFKYEKPIGVDGKLTLKALLKGGVLKELSNVNIQSKDLFVNNAAISFAPLNGKEAELYKGSIANTTIGKSKININFNLDDKNTMQVKIGGPTFDFAPFMDDAPKDNVQINGTNVPVSAPAVEQMATKEKRLPMDISLNVDTMLLKNEYQTKGAKTFVRIDDEGDVTQLEYNAKIGDSPLNVVFKPDGSGKRTFRLETSDAGAALSAFGLYENIRGGSLIIFGSPKGGDAKGNLFGTMRMEKFRVVKAPALAKILSLMSLSGVSQLLSNEGLVFSKLESGFEWRFRKSGNLLIIKDGQTSGSSIGLTFSGFIDRGKQKTDIAGTIIPMTEVNSILSKIPLVGDILGGAGGLIAATYSMKGPSSKPEVLVNPLSVLAPGIIRRILFEGGYERKIPGEDEEDGTKKPAKEDVKPQKPSNLSKSKATNKFN